MVALLIPIQVIADEILMGVEDIEYFPFYAKREGKYVGFAREVFDKFGKQYGHTITYKALPVKRLYGEFINGRVDLKFPDNPYWGACV